MSAKKMAQLCLQISNKPGELHKALRTVSDADVDILGYCGWTEGPGKPGHLLIVPANAPKARAALRKAGYKATSQDVVVARKSNSVGQGAKLAGRISKAGVNLSMVLATATGKKYVTIYAADDTAGLRKALK